ncbi:LOW QUALITY PROTEIN: uncharacterized protein LOC108111158 [Drosophila eugracilis]|uniref:LOW QUALITY PROTEIN: uncharacterized protein LOC108111158 n=1 Tax=Drosophila eugracilis TaxID=29029 RepID=UPI001BD9E562|nr:LOW QUALITY PROTEIN: uncharacterized protein LOC108111158 [Drosophila eugracilis]
MRLRNPLGRYFVNSSKCRMPYVDPFSSGVLATLEPVKYKTCSKESDFLTLNFDLNLQQYSLHANKEVLSKFLPSKAKMSCHYRGLSDDIDGKALKKSFQQTEVLSTKLTGIITECRLAGNTSEIFQQDAFPLIQIPNRTSTSDSQLVNKKPSVIILGLDSLSRMNFKRTMPGTSQFVKELGFFEMEGYNKVGTPCFPNLCAIFAGELSGKQCLERYPLLWKKFKEAGYITAFAEDILRSSISVQTPSDYELRSFLTQIAESMSIYRKFGTEYCIGRRLSLSYLYDFCMQFTERIIEELDHPAFGLFWSSSLTRNYPLGAIILDDKFMEYLELMRKHKVFERSIVILVSDQGQKESDFVKLPNAFLEERLPMLHIYLPEWFLIAYPKYAENLHLNRNRLTSPFDLHNTLNHLLSLNTSNTNELSPLQYCSTCQSLFHLVPQNRSCDEAGIGMNWCACNEFVPLPNDDRSYFLGKLLVFHINKWMLKRRFNRFCQRLQLLELDYMEEAISNDDGQEGTYSLRIRTFPIQGVFEATIRYREDLNDFIDLRMSDISSMINYHKHSMCINDKMAKKFCFCYPDKLNENMKVWKSLKRKKFAKQTSSFPSENVTLENPLIPFLDQS